MKALVLSAAAGAVFTLSSTAALPGDGNTAQEIRLPGQSKKEVVLDWLLDHSSLFTATREDFEKKHEKGTYAWLDKGLVPSLPLGPAPTPASPTTRWRRIQEHSIDAT